MSGIIYIVSDRRSGSTLLENLLGQIPSIVSIGELRMLQGHMKKEGPGEIWSWKCSCNNEILDCPMWSRVNQQVDLTNQRTRLDHSLFGPGSKLKDSDINKKLKDYCLEGDQVAQDCLKILDSVKDVTGSNWVVDSSKDILQAYYLHNNRPDEVRVIYLQRSIDALAFSKLRHKGDENPSRFRMLAFMRRVARQNKQIRNIVDRLPKDHCITLKYEELATHPKEEVARILDFLNISYSKDSLPDHLEPQESHSIGGTPSRFDRRPIVLDEKSQHYFKTRPVLAYLAKLWQK